MEESSTQEELKRLAGFSLTLVSASCQMKGVTTPGWTEICFSDHQLGFPQFLASCVQFEQVHRRTSNMMNLMKISGFTHSTWRKIRIMMGTCLCMWACVVFETQWPCRKWSQWVQSNKNQVPLRNTHKNKHYSHSCIVSPAVDADSFSSSTAGGGLVSLYRWLDPELHG